MEQHVKTLQQLYAMSQIDAMRWYTKHGITESVQEAKQQESRIRGHQTAQMLGITTAEGAFTTLSQLFGCANWTIQHDGGATRAVATSCTLCALARRFGTDQPCRMQCLDPLQGIVAGIDPTTMFVVEDTRWDGDTCRVRIR